MVFYYHCHVTAALEDTEGRVAECAVFRTRLWLGFRATVGKFKEKILYF